MRHFILTLFITASLTTLATADDRFWTRSSGSGLFNDTNNWSDTSNSGPSGATVPGVGDAAHFAGNNSIVEFDLSPTNMSIDFTAGSTTFDLKGHTYTTTDPVGISLEGSTNQVYITNGILRTDSATDQIRVGTTNNYSYNLIIQPTGQLGAPGMGELYVGYQNTGGIDIEHGGKAFASFISIGTSSVRFSNIDVEGTLDSSGDMIVGESGDGNLDIRNGGSVNTTLNAIIGNNAGSDGYARVDDPGSTWSIGSTLHVGDAGDGYLDVSFGGTVDVGNDVIIADKTTSSPNTSVLVRGQAATLNVGGATTVGNSGDGSLSISEGGKVSTQGVTIASNASSTSTATVEGADSQLISGSITVGNAGNGTLNVKTGAQVSSDSLTLGNDTNSQGTATISDTNTLFTVNDTTAVGNNGQGILTVENGARFISSVWVYVGLGSGNGTINIQGQDTQFETHELAITANGTLNFDGGVLAATRFINNGNLNWTDGTLKINGDVFDNAGASLTIDGADANDLPTLHMAGGATGVGVAASNVVVGNTNQGATKITGGSSLNVNSVALGHQDGSNGILTVEGAGSSLTTSGEISVGGSSTTGGGTGTINIETGGTVNANTLVRLWPKAALNLNGGTLITGNLIPAGGAVNFNSGRISFSSPFIATNANLNTILGLEHRLGLGRQLDSTSSITLDTPIEITGGRLEATNTFTNNSLLKLSHNLGTVKATQLTNNATITGYGRIDAQLNNTASGRVQVENGDDLFFVGVSNTNAGLIDVNGQSSRTTLGFTNGLTNNAAGRIDTRGTTELNFGAGLINDGLLDINFADTNIRGPITNNQSIAVAFSDATFSSGDITNNNFIAINNQSRVVFSDDVIANAGSDIFVADDSTVVFNGSFNGSTSGTGTVTIHGDLAPGSSPGMSEFGGDVIFGSRFTYSAELAGTQGSQYDQVSVTANVSLDGTLDIALLDVFTPDYFDTFEIISAGTRNGRFDEITGAFINSEMTLAPVYDYEGNAGLTLVAALPGDANLDGIVNGLDLLTWQANLFSGDGWDQGDFNLDGLVNGLDLLVWQSHLFDSVPSVGGSPAAAASVPEPGAGLLLLFGAVVLIRSSLR